MSAIAMFRSPARNAMLNRNRSLAASTMPLLPELPSLLRGFASAPSASVPAAPTTAAKPKKLLQKPVSVNTLRSMYKKRTPLCMLTAYDTTSAKLADRAGADWLLVGDSVGMVVLGMKDTTRVGMEDMVRHSQAVSRSVSRPFLTGDLPFGSYLTTDDALRNSARLVSEGGMHSVKLEGGRRVAPHIKAIVDAGMNVVGHIGLTPQTAAQLGGYRVQGKSTESAHNLMQDALALQDAGCMAVVLECVPDVLARFITDRLTVPTIGIGAGVHCSGQVQVFHDLLGLFDDFQPKFTRRYANTGESMTEALQEWVGDIREKQFPADAESYVMKEAVFEKFVEEEAQLLRREKTKDSLSPPPTGTSPRLWEDPYQYWPAAASVSVRKDEESEEGFVGLYGSGL